MKSEVDNCFPSTAKVNLENGESVMMYELKVGYRVQIGRSYSGLLHFK